MTTMEKLFLIKILECGGNLFDAVGLGVKAALRNTFIPRVVAAALDGCDPELVISEDPYDCWRLDTSKTPVFVTVMRVCRINQPIITKKKHKNINIT